VKKAVLTGFLLLASIASLAQTKPATKKTTSSAPAAAPAQKPAATPAKAEQNKAAEPNATAAAPAKAAEVAPDTVVATLTGICLNDAPPPCTIKITRQEFDILAASLNPALPVNQRRELAASYIQVLAMAAEGSKQNVDKDPLFHERDRLRHLELLAQATAEHAQEDYKPTDQEIETFYTENSSKFEEMSLRLIVIPKSSGDGMKPEERKAYADKIRERAVAGEDTDKLEAEVFATTKATGTPPSTPIGWKRKGTLPQQFDSQISALKAGEVGPVIEDAQNFYIVKVDSKRMVPLETEKDNIERAIKTQHAQAAIAKVRAGVHADLNEAYFGPPPQTPPVRPTRPAESAPPKKD
jgi:parvulin-like peptidyl-prolyl isomerase